MWGMTRESDTTMHNQNEQRTTRNILGRCIKDKENSKYR